MLDGPDPLPRLAQGGGYARLSSQRATYLLVEVIFSFVVSTITFSSYLSTYSDNFPWAFYLLSLFTIHFPLYLYNIKENEL